MVGCHVCPSLRPTELPETEARPTESLELMTTGPFYTTWALNMHQTVSARKASPAHQGTEDVSSKD